MFGNKTRDYSEGVVGTNEEEVSDNMAFGDHRMWSVSGDSYFPCEKTEQELPSGQYLPVYNENRGIYFVKKAVTLDNLMVLPDSKTTYVLDSIDDFWKREDKFREFGFLWKRGILLYGPPGSGKTSCLQQMSQKIIDNGGIAVYCTSPQITAEALRLLRRIEPNRPVVVLLEDIDAIISRHGEPDLLALLDGELQIDNVVYIATTNYPEDLDPRFVQRPSRFDEVILIDMPSADARMVYLGRKNPTLTAEQLEYWTSLTEGFSLAALKEVVVAVECLGKNLEETVKRIKEIMARKPSSEDATNPLKKGVGFT
jgi:SpoVK/Ycf46/Vps4 family AAA+-type ATPase